MAVGVVETVRVVEVMGGVEAVEGLAIYHLIWTLFLTTTYNSVSVVLETAFWSLMYLHLS